MKRLIVAPSIVLLFLLTSASPSVAQHHDYEHHHHYSRPAHRRSLTVISPFARLTVGARDEHHFVVPAHDEHHGGYYTHLGAHYYVPPTPVHVDVAPAPVVFEFGAYARMEDLSGRLETMANDLCVELHAHYRRNAGFREVYREAYEIIKIARHAHEHRGDRQEIRRSVKGLDSLFHHVETEFARWTPDDRHLSSDVAVAKLRAMEAVIHHLLHDAGIESHAAGRVEAPPPEAVAPPPE